MSATTVRTFISAFRSHWLAAMSGGVSVPFTALAVFLDNKWAQLIFAVLAFTAVWVAAYRIWKPERDRVAELEAKLTPKLKCSFDSNDDGCVRRNSPLNDTLKGTWYRLKVEAASNVSVHGCQGRLIEILRGDNRVFYGEKITLPFAYGNEADTTSKTIHPGVPEHLDFLVISYDNRIMLTPHGSLSASVNWNDMFTYPSDYTFKIAIVSPEADSSFVKIRIRWTLKHETTVIECVA